MALILAITNAGRAALRNADASGTRAVRIASVGVSAAALAATVATAALPGEIKRITTVSGAAVAADIIHLVVNDETMTTYTVRSFALYLDDGTLFAAYGQADPIIEKSAQALMVLTVDVTLADITASQITFGDANFLMPPATVDRQGLIELATLAEAKAGTDASRAVTPATAKGAVRDWIGYTPVDRAGDTFAGPVAIRHTQRNLGLFVAQSGTGYGFVQLGDAANPQALRTWHLGSQDDGSFALYQGIWGSGVLRLHVTSTTIAYNGNAVWHAGNDGAGSGLDADLLDGLQATQLLRADQSSTLATDAALDFINSAFGRTLRVGGNGYTTAGTRASVVTTNGNLHLDGAAGFRVFLNHYAGDGVNFSDGAGTVVASMSKGGALIAAAVDAAIMRRNGTNLVGFDNDGAGSGLDADMVDGLQAAQLLRADQSSTLATDAALDFVNSTYGRALRVGGNGYTSAGTRASVVTTNGNLHLDGAAGFRVFLNHYAGDGVNFSDGAGAIVATMSKSGALAAASVDAPIMRRNGMALVGIDNDGAGSGLDADLLDGRQATDFALLTGDTFTGPVTVRPVARNCGLRIAHAGTGYGFAQFGEAADANVSFNWHLGSSGNGEFGLYQGAWGSGILRLFVNSASITFNNNAIWHAGNDGAGSGLDADMVDGLQAGQFIRSDVATPIAANIGFDLVNTAWNRILRLGGNGYTSAGANASVVGTDGSLHLDAARDRLLYLNYYSGSGVAFGNGASGVVATIGKDGAFAAPSITAPTIAVDGGEPILYLRNRGNPADNAHGWTARSQDDELRFASPLGVRVRMHPFAGMDVATGITRDSNRVWDAGNDGSGSGLDADLLDGWDRDDIRRWGNLLDVPGAFPPAGHTHSAADIAGAFANASFGPSGYQVLPNGLILQWCTGALNSTGSEPAQFVGFPITFPNSCFVALVSTRIAGTSNGADAFYQTAGEPLTNGVTVQRQYTAQGSDNRATTPFVIAIGN